MKNIDLNYKVKLLNQLLDHNLKIINFFQSDLTKYKILLIVMKNYYQNKMQTIEKIIENLPTDISSRAHKLNFITEATSKKYFIKESTQSDLRKKNLKPSKGLIDEFEIYLAIFFNEK
jgi:hypothetical protein